MNNNVCPCTKDEPPERQHAIGPECWELMALKHDYDRQAEELQLTLKKCSALEKRIRKLEAEKK